MLLKNELGRNLTKDNNEARTRLVLNKKTD